MENIETLIDRYGASVYSLCKRLALSAADAEDLYQATFLTAMSKRVDPRGNPKAYLARICLNLWRGERRKWARRNAIAPGEELKEIPDPDRGPEEQLQHRQMLDAVRRAIDSLDEKRRTALLLYYDMDLPLEQIARIMNCPVGTVKSRLSAARTAVKKQLEVMGYDGG